MVFDGLNGKVDDGTIVVVGDIGEAFGENNVPWRTVQTEATARAKEIAAQKLAALPTDASPKEREKWQKIIDTPAVRRGVLTIPASTAYGLYDFYGNAVAAIFGKIAVPLSHRGFFLRPSGANGSMQKLLAALETADVRGFEPLEMIPFDFTSALDKAPVLRVKVSNVLNRAVRGTLTATPENSAQKSLQVLALAPHQSKIVTLPLRDIKARDDNAYDVLLRFDGGKDGLAWHRERCTPTSSRAKPSKLMASWTIGAARCRKPFVLAIKD